MSVNSSRDAGPSSSKCRPLSPQPTGETPAALTQPANSAEPLRSWTGSRVDVSRAPALVRPPPSSAVAADSLPSERQVETRPAAAHLLFFTSSPTVLLRLLLFFFFSSSAFFFFTRFTAAAAASVRARLRVCSRRPWRTARHRCYAMLHVIKLAVLMS